MPAWATSKNAVQMLDRRLKLGEGSSPLLILIADDDLGVRDSLCALLESAGYDTLVASSGKEAIAQLEQRPDLVLTDVNMPDSTGLEVIKAVRLTGRPVPIIAMSGWQPLGYSPLGSLRSSAPTRSWTRAI